MGSPQGRASVHCVHRLGQQLIALIAMGVTRLLIAKQQKATEEGKLRVPCYQLRWHFVLGVKDVVWANRARNPYPALITGKEAVGAL